MEEEKNEGIHDKKYWEEMWTRKALKGSRVSWYTWNSPVGLGLFFIEERLSMGATSREHYPLGG